MTSGDFDGVHAPDLPRPVSAGTERLFEVLSALRGRRIFHPQGIAFRATVHIEETVEGVPVFAAGASHDTLVRFSRALGLPRGRPDFLGLALRIGGEQDLLLASSSPAGFFRYVPLPARSFFGTTLTSLLPFHAGERVVVAGAHVGGAASGADDQLTDLAEAAAQGPIAVVLALAEPGGRWRRVARLEVGARLPDAESRALRFDAWRCGGGLVPWGRINSLRAPAYRGSRRGRAA